MALTFFSYLVCMWAGVGIGVIATAIFLAAKDSDIIRRGRNRWH